jgi:hypothetical protein
MISNGNNQFVAMGYRWRWSINRVSGGWLVNIRSRRLDYDASVRGSYSDAKAFVDENIKSMQLCENLHEFQSMMELLVGDRMAVFYD